MGNCLCHHILQYAGETSVRIDINSNQVKIKYEFSKLFPCDCRYVQQNMIIHDILTRPFGEKYKFWEKSMIKIFPIEDNAFLK